MARPLVLCSNDDGIESPHLEALAARIEAFADVVVVAPERQRSAASHAITLHKPLRLTEVRPRRFSLSGTPVDCVYLGVLKLCDRSRPWSCRASTTATTSAATSSTRARSPPPSRARCEGPPGSRARSRRMRRRSTQAIAVRRRGRARGDRRADSRGHRAQRQHARHGQRRSTSGRCSGAGSTRTTSPSARTRAVGRTTGSAAARPATTMSRAPTASRSSRGWNSITPDAPRSDRSRSPRAAAVGHRRAFAWW